MPIYNCFDVDDDGDDNVISRIYFRKDDEITNVTSFFEDIESEILDRLLHKAVEIENVDGIRKHLFRDNHKKIKKDIESHFQTNDHFIEANKEIRNHCCCCIP